MSNKIPKDRDAIRAFADGQRFVSVRHGQPVFATNDLTEARRDVLAHGGGTYDAWADRFINEKLEDGERMRVRAAAARARRSRRARLSERHEGGVSAAARG